MLERASTIVRIFISSFLKRFFLLLYHQMAWAYDFVAWNVSLGKWKAWVTSVIPYLTGPKILEIGHGPGHLQAALSAKGLWSCGLDESWWMSAIASKRCDKLINCPAQKMPFPENTFSQVVATFPAEFIFESATLSEIYRVLETGGELILLPVAWITGNQIQERIAAWLFRITGQAPDRKLNRTHTYFTIPLERAHFQVSTRIIETQNSEILILVARKGKLSLSPAL